MGPSVAASAVRAGVKLVIAGCLVIMNLVAWGYITDEVTQRENMGMALLSSANSS
jgi:hypothetical protein